MSDLEHPLDIVGIRPELARKLSVEELSALTTASLRILRNHHHTDTGGTASDYPVKHSRRRSLRSIFS